MKNAWLIFIITLFACGGPVAGNRENQKQKNPEYGGKRSFDVDELEISGAKNGIVDLTIVLEPRIEMLSGSWNNQDHHFRLFFQKNGTFDVMGYSDSICSLRYRIEKNHILSETRFSPVPQKFTSTINYLSKDTLILGSLLNIKERMIFILLKKGY